MTNNKCDYGTGRVIEEFVKGLMDSTVFRRYNEKKLQSDRR